MGTTLRPRPLERRLLPLRGACTAPLSKVRARRGQRLQATAAGGGEKSALLKDILRCPSGVACATAIAAVTELVPTA